MDFSLNLFIIIADQCMLFIINMLVARHAGEELFGDFSVATRSLLLLATIVTFGIDSIIAYYVPKYFVRKRFDDIADLTTSLRTFLQPIYRTLFLGGVLLSLAIIALSRAIGDVSLFEISHPFFLFLWGAVGISLYSIFIQFFRAVDYMRTAILLSLTQTIFYFLLTLFTYFFLYPVLFHDNRHYFPHVMLIGFILSYVLIVWVSFAIEKKTELKELYYKKGVMGSLNWKEKMYGYTLQNLNRYVFSTIPLLMIELFGSGKESVGLFSAIVSIVSLAFIALNPIGILIGPEISAAFAQTREVLKKTVTKYILLSFLVSLVVVLIVAFSAKEILLLYKSGFIRALPYTYFCLINIITFSISMPLSRVIQYSKRGNKIGAKLTIAMLSLQFLACLILIPLYDLMGAVICFVGINIVYNITMIYLAIKIYHSDPFGQEVI
ncbi:MULTISPECIES: hypothetical protein [Legionella]|uniref:Polysaccharide biosynthesis protein n=1 Tax=Legionella drozanskii LLAP-1 TaxID=1212489 RepID=A0A0W0SXC8_9GAMM|nr:MULTISPECIES: hypothetical protein [Legionella]KTC88016.1 hypothetical protein Ldro_1635 [Legionella drozanskii LLAP-1]PJE07340.1 MAG: hypothetical protein CK430_14080 [Legionella sp.]